MLTYEHVVAVIEEAELTREQAPELYSYLDEHGIELVGGEETSAGESEPAEPGPREPVETAKRELDLTVEPSLDSLRLYLRAIGRVPLLTRDRGGRAREAHRARRHGRQAARWSRRTCASSSRSRRATSGAA